MEQKGIEINWLRGGVIFNDSEKFYSVKFLDAKGRTISDIFLAPEGAVYLGFRDRRVVKSTKIRKI